MGENAWLVPRKISILLKIREGHTAEVSPQGRVVREPKGKRVLLVGDMFWYRFQLSSWEATVDVCSCATVGKRTCTAEDLRVSKSH